MGFGLLNQIKKGPQTAAPMMLRYEPIEPTSSASTQNLDHIAPNIDPHGPHPDP